MYKKHILSIKANTKHLSNPDYKYDNEYIDILKEIKNNNLNSKFII